MNNCVCFQITGADVTWFGTIWIDMDGIDTWGEVRDVINDTLIDAACPPCGEEDEIVAIDALGLCVFFTSTHGIFDMDRWVGWASINFNLEDAASAFLSNIPDASYDAFIESYIGEFAHPGDYAAQYMKDRGALVSIPECIRGYIDFKAMENDWELSGDIFRSNGYVFRNL